MPDDAVADAVAPFVHLWLDFELPANQSSERTATCPWFGGKVVALMPHMHQWATGFDVRFLGPSGEELSNPYSRGVGELGESDIAMFSPPVDTRLATHVSFTCSWFNPLDHSMRNGFGENEMCYLFGYVSPPEATSLGVVLDEQTPCMGFQLSPSE